MRRTLIFAGLLACGPESTDTADTSSSTATTTTTTTAEPDPTTSSASTGPDSSASSSSSSGEPTTGGPAFSCACSEQVNCPGELDDCPAPEPCDLVDELDPTPADCVLERLEQDDPGFFKFRYCHNCVDNPQSYRGTFVVRGADRPGVDMLCEYFDFSEELKVVEHTLESPAYFKACREIATFKERRTCLLNGFEPGATVPMCE